jgi:predicted GIY-YIG superfamily endonuclease
MPIINCGIYVLYFECDDEQYYIGKSIDIQTRYKNHCSELKNNRHINKTMQKAYLLHGLPTVMPLEEVLDLEYQNIREITWIKELDTYTNGMNGTIGGDGTGCGADSPRSLYPRETYIEILQQLANTTKNTVIISQELFVSKMVVQSISRGGGNHAWLAIEFPELYAKMLLKKGTRLRSFWNRPIKQYPIIKSPEGILFNISNIRKFARDNNLHQSHLGNVLRGIVKSHKGWTLAQ